MHIMLALHCCIDMTHFLHGLKLKENRMHDWFLAK